MENLKTKLLNLSNQKLEISQFVIFYLKSVFAKTDYLFIPIFDIQFKQSIKIEKSIDQLLLEFPGVIRVSKY
jgi:hypothetical protein